jgi:hypothetical protein
MALELLLLPFILLQSMLFSPCSLVRTKFPNRVIHDASQLLSNLSVRLLTGVMNAAPTVFPNSSVQKKKRTQKIGISSTGTKAKKVKWYKIKCFGMFNNSFARI